MPETARNITAPGCLPKNLPSQLSKASSLRMQRAKDSAHHITTPTSARYADPDAPSPSNHYYHSPSLKSSSCENISLSYMRMQRAKSSAQHITPQTSSRRTHLDAPFSSHHCPHLPHRYIQLHWNHIYHHHQPSS